MTPKSTPSMIAPMMFSAMVLVPLDLADQGELAPLSAVALHDEDPNVELALTHGNLLARCDRVERPTS